MVQFENVLVPADGARIELVEGTMVVPDNPVIPFIWGDGTGPDISRASQKVWDAAVEKAYGGKRRIRWMRVYAGEESKTQFDTWLPDDTVKAIEHFRVGIKGPLTTPVGGGIRSLNVALRQLLDLYACVRPVRWFEGVPAPVKEPGKLNVTIFRENTEDIYAGIEWKRGDPFIPKLFTLLKEDGKLGKIRFPDSAGVGLKPVSEEGSKRLVRAALQYAIRYKRRSVTLVHKGNIMKFTEGAFKDWGYEVAVQEFRDSVITEDELWDQVKGADGVTPEVRPGSFAALRGGKPAGDPNGRVVVKDRIADAMFQQILLRPDEYDVLATCNLNGDYLSDACAAQVGGLGMAPGGNINYVTGHALFEATHGTAPKYANQDKVNPGSLILSGVMMLQHMGWDEAARLVEDALDATIRQKRVTYDLERQMAGATLLKTSQFADAIIGNMEAPEPPAGAGAAKAAAKPKKGKGR